MLRVLSLLILLTPGLPAGAVAGTILVVGDSLSASYGLAVGQGWVSLLQQRLDARHAGWTVVNASISGDTTAGARARLPQALERHQPEVVILALGGNDGLRGLSLGQMQDNLGAMIESAREQGARVLLVGVQLPPNYGPQYTERFENVYRDLARQRGVRLMPSLVDGVGTRPELMQGDGIHPNASAQPLMMERVWEHLQPLLGAARAAGATVAANPGIPEENGCIRGPKTASSEY
ncbi:MAG: arylesterase [Gammaproteobacteria bacterium]|jgi:acyl-CoA thioesterase-1